MNRPVIKNLLLENIDYKTDKTQFGVWRRFVYPNGDLFEEFKSHSRFMGFPLMHYTRGKCPETGQRIIAKGIIAIGRRPDFRARPGINRGLRRRTAGIGLYIGDRSVRDRVYRHRPICVGQICAGTKGVWGVCMGHETYSS